MAEPLFLTPDELQELTGLKRPSAQIRWLQRKGYPHEINAIGRPVVCRSAVERKPEVTMKPWEPDWSLLG